MTVASAYPTYRRTDLNWFECVPESWAILRTKQMFRLVIERAPENNQMELLSVYTHIGVRPRKSLEQRGNKASTTDGYWVVKKGDIICNKLLAWMGAIGVSHYEGVTSPAYDILRPVKSCNTDYYHFLFRTKKYLQQFKLRSRGIMDMRLRLYFDQFGQIPIPVPPRPEQDQIVAYLRAQDAHIVRFIKAKRELIKLLTEQKLRIIDHAVTRGLDAAVALKPSGIEWQGEVPEHWEISRLRACIKTIRAGVWGSDPSDKNLSDQLVCVRVADFDMEKLAVGTSKLTVRAVSQNERSGRLLCSGDILLEKSGGGEKTPVGRVVAFTLDKVSVCSNFLARLVPNTELVRSAFLLTVLNHLHARRIVIPYIKQTTGIQNLDSTAYFKLGIALPSLNEQDEILQVLARDCKPIEEAIQRANEEIKLIREYRDRLIADVVTGQVDVRGWQPGPEDVVDDAALGDDPEDVTEEEDGDGED